MSGTKGTVESSVGLKCNAISDIDVEEKTGYHSNGNTIQVLVG